MSGFGQPFERITLAFDYLRESFTLFDISMTLILIGLLLGGGVLTRELIYVAELRAQAGQIRHYEEALHLFERKYAGYPGDLKYANRYFTGAPDGNGNGFIEDDEGFAMQEIMRWNTAFELQQLFIQLSRSQIIREPFDGRPVIGSGLPALAYNGQAGFFIAASDIFLQDRGEPLFQQRNNAIWFVACSTNEDLKLPADMMLWMNACAIFKPHDLQSLDEKIDDGAPRSGQLHAFGGMVDARNGRWSGCVEEGVYNSSKDTLLCQAAYNLN